MVYLRLSSRRAAGLSLLDIAVAALAVAFVAVVVIHVSGVAEGPALTGKVDVIDGDSLRLDGREVRLAGIDAPELHQICERGGRPYECGRIARRVLAEKRLAGNMTCRLGGTDRYGRALGRCFVGAEDVNAAMVREGWAVSYGRYEHEEGEARAARRGLWQGTFERPADWRRAHPRHDGG
jgi:endonuclease YncB( thermonuclease family)